MVTNKASRAIGAFTICICLANAATGKELSATSESCSQIQHLTPIEKITYFIEGRNLADECEQILSKKRRIKLVNKKYMDERIPDDAWRAISLAEEFYDISPTLGLDVKGKNILTRHSKQRRATQQQAIDTLPSYTSITESQ